MSGEETGAYEAPAITEYGSVESLTEQQNKASPGSDTDGKARNLNGSISF